MSRSKLWAAGNDLEVRVEFSFSFSSFVRYFPLRKPDKDTWFCLSFRRTQNSAGRKCSGSKSGVSFFFLFICTLFSLSITRKTHTDSVFRSDSKHCWKEMYRVEFSFSLHWCVIFLYANQRNTHWFCLSFRRDQNMTGRKCREIGRFHLSLFSSHLPTIFQNREETHCGFSFLYWNMMAVPFVYSFAVSCLISRLHDRLLNWSDNYT